MSWATELPHHRRHRGADRRRSPSSPSPWAPWSGRSAAAVTLVIAIVVLPYFLAIIAALPDSVADWIVRLHPGGRVLPSRRGAVPAYPQVEAIYSPAGGYYPLPPWASLLVLVAWAALALTAAIALLRRRDA